MAFIFNKFIVHILIGVSLGVLNAVLLRKSKFRFFRFGGYDPISWGNTGRWLLWYSIFALPFEFVTSTLTNEMYLEFGLSAVQAILLTFGLFVVDRVAMMFEPEERWRPKSPSAISVNTSKPALAEPNDSYKTGHTQEAAIVANSIATKETAPVTSAVNPADTSWFKKNVDAATERLGEVPKGFFKKIRTAVSESQRAARESLEARRMAHEEKRIELERAHEAEARRLADEKAKRLDRLRDLTRGH